MDVISYRYIDTKTIEIIQHHFLIHHCPCSTQVYRAIALLFSSKETPLLQRHVRFQQPGCGSHLLQGATLHEAGESRALRHRRLLLQRRRPPRPLHGSERAQRRRARLFRDAQARAQHLPAEEGGLSRRRYEMALNSKRLGTTERGSRDGSSLRNRPELVGTQLIMSSYKLTPAFQGEYIHASLVPPA